MNPLETIRFALRGVTANKLRSGLTVLGILIGVGAVILLVAVGNGAQQQIQKNIEALGTNTLTVLPGGGRAAGATSRNNALTPAIAAKLVDHSLAPDVLSASPVVTASEDATYSGVDHTIGQFIGTVPEYLPATNYSVASGSSFTAADVTAGRKVVLLGTTVAGDLFPAGVFSVVTGDGATGAALASHPGVAKVALIGSVNAGRAVMRAGADHIRPVLLELGGKNALIAFADADPGAVARAAVAGMNFGWCGQSCGSTSRAFLHDAIHDEVLDRVRDELKQIRPGPPEDPATTMGALVSRAHRDRVLGYIARGQAEGARLVAGGGPPAEPGLADGCFIEPTVFAGVTQDMTIAREEIFGPVLSVLRWDDPQAMLADVNSTPFGLTCSIWTSDLAVAHETAAAAEAGYVWVNEVARHFPGAPFGGYKQSGTGREECLDELLDFTQQKNIHIRYRPG